MSKTDKELTAEIVTTYVTSWNGANTKPINFQQLKELIKTVHETIHDLPETNQK